MKRAAIIVGVVLSIAVVVGAFIVGGGDNASEAKGPTTTAKQSNEVKDATKAIEVASGGPTTTEKKKDDADNKSDDEGKPGKYEISKASVRVSPPTLRKGEELKIEVKNFQPGETVLITVTPAAGGGPAISKTLVVKKNNQGKLEIDKPNLTEGQYTVSATGLTSTGFASTNLKVVKKS